MDVSGINLFALAEERLSWLEKRQETLAGNIANANTPGWKPRDLPDFTASLARAGGVSPAVTQPNHIAITTGRASTPVTPRPAARAPDGNAVSLDEQLMKVADTETTQEMVTAVYSKYLGFFRMALGRGS